MTTCNNSIDKKSKNNYLYFVPLFLMTSVSILHLQFSTLKNCTCTLYFKTFYKADPLLTVAVRGLSSRGHERETR